VIKRAPKMGKDQIIVMNLCGRGDKDIFTVGKILDGRGATTIDHDHWRSNPLRKSQLIGPRAGRRSVTYFMGGDAPSTYDTSLLRS
jgi:hypothetical protein